MTTRLQSDFEHDRAPTFHESLQYCEDTHFLMTSIHTTDTYRRLGHAGVFWSDCLSNHFHTMLTRSTRTSFHRQNARVSWLGYVGSLNHNLSNCKSGIYS